MRYIPLLFTALFAACASISPLSVSGENDMPDVRYLALGDSYTIGESVPEEDRWPNQLAKLLESEGTKTDVTIIARTGWTVDELWEGIQAVKPEPPYDLVSLLIGVNNQYRGYDINEYREQFNFLLTRSIEYAAGNADHVIVLSIPDWGVTLFAAGRDQEQIAKDIDNFNRVNREESEKAGVHYVDITPISRNATSDTTLTASDELHPSGEMYSEWAELVLPKALDILK